MSKSKISPAMICCLTSVCLLTPVIPKEVKANNLNFQQNQQETSYIAQRRRRFSRLRFRLPNRGVPGARIGGATRTSGSKSVMAILPDTKLGLTASQSPMIFVYIPKNQSTQAVLTITDEQNNQVYQGDFVAPQEVGILRIKLPETVNLETDKMYKWTVQLIPSMNNPMMKAKLKTFGWVSKVSLADDSLSDEKQTWTDLDTLAQAGIWHDTLEQLAKLRLENPDDQQLEAEWNDLLSSVGLDSFSNKNIFADIVEINSSEAQEVTDNKLTTEN